MAETINKEVEAFRFKEFAVEQDQCAMKVGTDGILLGAWASTEKVQKVLDIGTGCGVVAIMIAQRAQSAEVHGIEIEAAAHQQATANMADSPWSANLKAIHKSIQDYAKLSREEYDLIVSNPPFFSGGTFSLNENRNNVRHTVKLAHGDLLSASRKLLSKNGKLCIILPLMEGLRLKELCESYRLYCTKITEIKSRPDKSTERLLMQFEKTEKEVVKEELVVYASPRSKKYSAAYIELTKAYYLNM